MTRIVQRCQEVQVRTWCWSGRSGLCWTGTVSSTVQRRPATFTNTANGTGVGCSSGRTPAHRWCRCGAPAPNTAQCQGPLWWCAMPHEYRRSPLVSGSGREPLPRPGRCIGRQLRYGHRSGGGGHPPVGCGQRNRSCGRAAGPAVRGWRRTPRHRPPTNTAHPHQSVGDHLGSQFGLVANPLSGYPSLIATLPVISPTRRQIQAPIDQGRGLCRWCKSCTPRPDYSRSARPFAVYDGAPQQFGALLRSPVSSTTRIASSVPNAATTISRIGGDGRIRFARASRCCSLSGVRCGMLSQRPAVLQSHRRRHQPHHKRGHVPPPPSGRTEVRSWRSSPPAGPATDHGLCSDLRLPQSSSFDSQPQIWRGSRLTSVNTRDRHHSRSTAVVLDG